MPWHQTYNPLHNWFLSTAIAALPLLVLMVSIAFLRVRIHTAALGALAVAVAVAIVIFGMPASSAMGATTYGLAFGLFPIGWIVLNVMFLYDLTERRGLFESLRQNLARLAPDPRVQLILIAFSFGAFIEGVSGFGTPVAITGAILIQLGFKPLHASGLALIANTAPVAFGSLGIPITTLEQVTGLDARQISAMVGRQLPFFSLLIPFWIVAAYAGWRGMLGVWPAALTAGAAFAIPQFLVSNFHGPWLVDPVAAACSIGALLVQLRFWKPSVGGRGSRVEAGLEQRSDNSDRSDRSDMSRSARPSALMATAPWIILTAVIFLWGTPQFKAVLDRTASPNVAVPGLHELVQRTPPIAAAGAKPETAVFRLNILSATGTGILFAALLSGALLGFRPTELLKVYGQTVWRVRYSLLTIMGMLALGNVTKYSGSDGTLGLAMARTGALYPFFGTLLGWLGVALTGSDTASNVLFGSLQRITAEQRGLSPILMGAANSSGGVMGKMVDAQSIVVASTATNWYGHEGSILRFVFFHSLALACLLGVLVYLQASVFPFTTMVVK
ncbi:MAG: lactate permease [Verrucomicrobia bacterium]|nr:MAG: lactate permease [Verrucomicrobiota bacterium]